MKYPDLTKIQILHYPDPRLREHARDLKDVDSFLKELTARMGELMREAQGVGLAATQLGLPFRFIILNPTLEPGKFEGFVNPEIVRKEGKLYEEEGCLSLPGLFAKVRRFERVTVRATLLTGETVELNAEAMPARIWQHELDHLDGGLFIDRIGPATRIMLSGRLREMEEQFQQEAETAKPKP